MQRLCAILLPAAVGWAALSLPGCGRARRPQAEAPAVALPSAAGSQRPGTGDGPTAGEPPVKWETAFKPGPAVLLRLKRATGKAAMYEGTLSRRQEGKNKYVETGSLYLTFICNGPTAEGYDRLAIRRTFLERSMRETLESGRVQDRILENTDELVNLGPNCDFVGQQRCYAFDAQNRVAYRADEELALKDGSVVRGTISRQDDQELTLETAEGPRRVARAEVAATRLVPTPHVLHYDTPHYFFPILSGKPVEPGETWVFRVPAIVPIPQGGGAMWLPTQFDVRMTGRLREVRGAGDEQVAVVDYRYWGAFDSAEEPFRSRFSAAFLDANRVRHELDGQGLAEIHVSQGLMLSRQDAFVVRLQADSTIVSAPDKPARQEKSWAAITSRLDLKLLAPGTRLRSGAVVPPNQ
jgi:hypothetical protein